MMSKEISGIKNIHASLDDDGIVRFTNDDGSPHVFTTVEAPYDEPEIDIDNGDVEGYAELEAAEELWIVAIDTSHYPEIHEFDNETEATAAYHKALNKRQRPDCGDDYAYYTDESTVYMAKVERVGELEER